MWATMDEIKTKKIPKLRFRGFSGEWEVKKLGDIADVRDGTHESPEYVEKGKPLVTSKNLLKNGKLDLSNVSYISEIDFENINRRSGVGVGDILFGMIGTIGNPVRVNSNNFAIKNVALIKENGDLLNSYLIQYLSSPVIEKQFFKKNAGGTQKFIALGIIRDLSIGAPAEDEQEKIAGFLGAIDDKISGLGKKKELLEKYKKGVMQKIFTQQIRFKNENGQNYPGWQEKRLDSVLIKNSQKNKGAQYKIVQSVSNRKGFIDQTDIFKDHVIASKDLSNYYVIKQGVFAYNPSRINVGSLAYQSDDRTTVVSPLYVCFRADNAILKDQYLLNWFNTSKFVKQMNNSFEGSVRNTLSYDSLKKMKIEIPTTEEQQKIAGFLTAIDDKIELTKKELEQAKRFKKSLLQQMFV